MKKITPLEFKKRMEELASMCDEESAHAEDDKLMEQVLEERGFKDGVEVFKRMLKWYA
jgi:hypothetical protein